MVKNLPGWTVPYNFLYKTFPVPDETESLPGQATKATASLLVLHPVNMNYFFNS